MAVFLASTVAVPSALEPNARIGDVLIGRAVAPALVRIATLARQLHLAENERLPIGTMAAQHAQAEHAAKALAFVDLGNGRLDCVAAHAVDVEDEVVRSHACKQP
jgi:hypothetical protein